MTDYDLPCPECSAQGYHLHPNPQGDEEPRCCPRCGGLGRVLTEEGRRVVAFLQRTVRASFGRLETPRPLEEM